MDYGLYYWHWYTLSDAAQSLGVSMEQVVAWLWTEGYVYTGGCSRRMNRPYIESTALRLGYLGYYPGCVLGVRLSMTGYLALVDYLRNQKNLKNN